jgi:hypothetical protein
MRLIALVIKSDHDQITVVTMEGETVEECLDRRNIEWIKYLPI